MASSYDAWWVKWFELLGDGAGVLWKLVRVLLVLAVLGALLYGCGAYLKWILHS